MVEETRRNAVEAARIGLMPYSASRVNFIV